MVRKQNGRYEQKVGAGPIDSRGVGPGLGEALKGMIPPGISTAPWQF